MPAFASSSPAHRPVPGRRSARALPGLCALCHRWCAGRFCSDCLGTCAASRPRCRQCALAVPIGVDRCGRCLREPPPHVAAVAAIDYTAPWDAVITRYKFHDGLDLAPDLADLLTIAVVRAELPRPDLVLPAPLADTRLRERGWNQSWELARRVARGLALRADAQLLLRVRATPHQIDLPHDARHANVRHAFAVEPLRRADLQGRHVAVVDDVMTTGATQHEMARTLLAAGAASVQAWALARTPEPGSA